MIRASNEIFCGCFWKQKPVVANNPFFADQVYFVCLQNLPNKEHLWNVDVFKNVDLWNFVCFLILVRLCVSVRFEPRHLCSICSKMFTILEAIEQVSSLQVEVGKINKPLFHIHKWSSLLRKQLTAHGVNRGVILFYISKKKRRYARVFEGWPFLFTRTRFDWRT